jgi:hypothetical protein
MARAFLPVHPGIPLASLCPIIRYAYGAWATAFLRRSSTANAWVDISTPDATQMSVVQVKNNLQQAQMD